MAYRDVVLANGGQPEIWFEFDPNDGYSGLDGSGYGERGDGRLIRQLGTAELPTLTGPANVGALHLNGSTYYRSGNWNGTYYTFAYFNTSTLSVWVNTTNATAAQTVLAFASTTSSNNNSYYFRLDLINGVPQVRYTVTTAIVSGSTSIADGQWHHLVFQRNGANAVSFWIDGVLVVRKTMTLGDNQSGTMWIGRNAYSGWGGYYTGYMAQPMHYPGGLTDAQIIAQYQGAFPSVVPSFIGWGIPAH